MLRYLNTALVAATIGGTLLPVQTTHGQIGACCIPGQPYEIAACENLGEADCLAVGGMFQEGEACAVGGQQCPLGVCFDGSGECTLPHAAFCLAGPDEGQLCNPILNNCLGICIGGPDEGAPCTFRCAAPGVCTRRVCVGGPNDGKLCYPDDRDACPDGSCSQPICMGSPGCNDPGCCTDVCRQPNMVFCCDTHWDEICALVALSVCPGLRPSNDECYDPDSHKGARLVGIPASLSAHISRATVNPTDPGFCCHTEDPGARGFATVWYRFIATDTSARVSTCCTGGGPDGRAEDSLIEVFSVPDPDRGICSDLSPCSVSAQDCADGSECVFDERTACGSLMPIGCNDDRDGGGCFCEPEPDVKGRSTLCVTGLTPGDPYYVMLGAKTPTDDDLGIYRLHVTSPCWVDPPSLHNDLCQNAEQHTGGYPETLVIPFDLSGEMFGEAPATFDCPGPPMWCSSTTRDDVWYDWTAPATGELSVMACAGPEARRSPTFVAYRGCECPVEDDRIVACGDVFEICFCPNFLRSCARFDVVEGECYKIRVRGTPESIPGGEVTISLTGPDCNHNGLPDDFEIANGWAADCNQNGIPDECDIDDGTSFDSNGNGVPDECELIVRLDIKPGSCPNPVNPRSKGVVPIAVVGSEAFDVRRIEVDSLTLARADAVGRVVMPLTQRRGPRISIDDVGTTLEGERCDCHDLGGDGIDDLVLKFSTTELVEALELASVPRGTFVSLTLGGSLTDGTAFEASDCILIVGKDRPGLLRNRSTPR